MKKKKKKSRGSEKDGQSIAKLVFLPLLALILLFQLLFSLYSKPVEEIKQS